MSFRTTTRFAILFAIACLGTSTMQAYGQNSASLQSVNQSYLLTADDGGDTTLTDSLSALLAGGSLDFGLASMGNFSLNSNTAMGGATAIDPGDVMVTARLANAQFDVQIDTAMSVVAGQSSEIQLSYSFASSLGINVAQLSLGGQSVIGDGAINVMTEIEDDIGFFTLETTNTSPFGEAILSAADLIDVTTTVSVSAPAGSGVTACDFNNDAQCDITDLDLLYANFGGAAMFDVNSDGIVNPADIRPWLTAASSPMNPYLGGTKTFRVGDLNLNGEIDSADLGLLLNNFGDDSGLLFGAGNLNNDTNVDSADLGDLLNNFGFASATTAAVPEPAAFSLIAIAMLSLFSCCGRRR